VSGLWGIRSPLWLIPSPAGPRTLDEVEANGRLPLEERRNEDNGEGRNRHDARSMESARL